MAEGELNVEPTARAEWWRRTARQPAQDRASVQPRPATSPVAFWALMVFMGILLVAPQIIFPVFAPLRIALLAAGVAVIAHVLDRWFAGRPVTVVTREMKIAVCLLGWAIVTIPFSYWPGGSVAALTDLFLKSLVLFWLIANTVTTVLRFRQFAWGLNLMSVPIAATALMNYLSGTFLQGAERIPGYDAPLTANPNDLALTLNLIIPFTLTLLRLTRGSLLRAILLAILVLNVTAVVLTFSRGGILTLAVILGITVTRLLRSPKRVWGVVLLAILLACLPLLPASYWHRLATITDIESDETGSAQARRDSSLGALRFVLTHPLVGAGIGSDVLALNEQIGPTWTVVHNVYLQYAVDLGLPGLGLFLALFAACLASASTARHRAGRGRDARNAAHLAQATWLSLIAFGVAALFHPVAYNFYFYYLAGLATACRMVLAQRTRCEATSAAVHPR
jgi:probable O-glycosylation ligase (exosortase A-associated)